MVKHHRRVHSHYSSATVYAPEIIKELEAAGLDHQALRIDKFGHKQFSQTTVEKKIHDIQTVLYGPNIKKKVLLEKIDLHKLR